MSRVTTLTYTVYNFLGERVGSHVNFESCMRWVKSLGMGYFTDNTTGISYDRNGDVL